MSTDRPANWNSLTGALQKGAVQVAARLLDGVRYSRPDGAPMKRRTMVLCYLRCLRHFHAFRDWFTNSDNPRLQAELANRPSLVACVRRPYLNNGWSAVRKMEVIRVHYHLLSHQFAQLRVHTDSPLLIARVNDELELQIEQAQWFEHEGELTFSLFQGHLRVYSIAFTFGRTDGRCVAYVGAVQGIGSEAALAIYRTMTRQMEGLRPRDLLLTAFRRFCVGMGVTRILAIADEASVSRSAYFGSGLNRVFANYNEVWIENGGREVEGGFFEIASMATRRPIAEITSRKRAQYRRRYALLDAMNERIDAHLSGLPSGAAKCSTLQSLPEPEFRAGQVTDSRSALLSVARHAESS